MKKVCAICKRKVKKKERQFWCPFCKKFVFYEQQGSIA